MKNRNKNMPANQNLWFSANGSDEWGNGADGWAGADGWQGADGDRQTQQHSAKPYIIKIVNACTSAISSVDIGDSYANRTVSNFSQNSNITITSLVNGVSYIEYLAQSEAQPFAVGATVVISSTANQLDESITVTHRNATGDRQDFTIALSLDPYQTQTDRIVDFTEYLFDGFSRLRYNSILGSATVITRQFLKGKFAPSQIVANRPGMQSYGNPNIIKAMPMAVGPNKNLGMG